jgi:alpha-glucosidase
VSNWHHLRMAIPLSLGLAMSGLPFNGPDVGGFMRDTTPELAVAWYKAGFLFPFLRNHSNRDTRDQEPWALGEKARQVIGHYVRLRYKLLPYLYQLFIRHERTGEAIQRPLFHDFVDTETQPLGRIEDQFLVGPDIMQAPLLVEGQTERSVILPAGVNWFDGRTGEWEPGGRTVDVRTEAAETPLYVREGALIPMQVGERTDNRNDLATIELHCVVKRSNRGCYRLLYVCDDGETVSYQRGEQTTVEFIVTVQPGELQVEARVLEAKFRPIVVSVVTYDRFERVAILVGGVKQVMPLRPHSWRLAGRSLATNITDVVLIGGQPAVVSAGRTEAACEPSGMPGADRV